MLNFFVVVFLDADDGLGGEYVFLGLDFVHAFDVLYFFVEEFIFYFEVVFFFQNFIEGLRFDVEFFSPGVLIDLKEFLLLLNLSQKIGVNTF